MTKPPLAQARECDKAHGMGLWNKFFHKAEPRDALRPLYAAIVSEARAPDWYAQGTVPDTIDGRFDMLALLLCLVLFRMEVLGPAAARDSALLTELFIEDMDGNLREIGIGDIVVGKHIGKMMAALGGRLSAYRDVRSDSAALKAALLRNAYRGAAPGDAALDFVAGRVQALDARMNTIALEALLAGSLGSA